MTIEKLPVIIKPHVEPVIAGEILNFLELKLKRFDLETISQKRAKPERQFWEEFYADIKDIFKGWQAMIGDFTNCTSNGLDGCSTFILYQGSYGLVDAAKSICGPTNPDNFGRNYQTIRQRFGHRGMGHRNLIHIPNPDEIERDLRILEKYGLIDYKPNN